MIFNAKLDGLLPQLNGESARRMNLQIERDFSRQLYDSTLIKAFAQLRDQLARQLARQLESCFSTHEGDD